MVVRHLELHLQLRVLLLQTLVSLKLIGVFFSVLVFIVKLAFLAAKIVEHLSIILLVVVVDDILLATLDVDLPSVQSVAQLILLLIVGDQILVTVVVLLLIVDVVLPLDDHSSLIVLNDHLTGVYALSTIVLAVIFSVILALALLEEVPRVCEELLVLLPWHRQGVWVLLVFLLEVLHQYGLLLCVEVVEVKVFVLVLTPTFIFVIRALTIHSLLDQVLLVDLFDLLGHGINAVLLLLAIRALVVLNVLASSEDLLFDVRVQVVFGFIIVFAVHSAVLFVLDAHLHLHAVLVLGVYHALDLSLAVVEILSLIHLPLVVHSLLHLEGPEPIFVEAKLLSGLSEITKRV